MLTLMGTIIIKSNLKLKPKQTRTRQTAKSKNESAKTKQFSYIANNNNKTAASRQNTKSLINFDYNRCVFSTFLFLVRYSVVCEKIRGHQFLFVLFVLWISSNFAVVFLLCSFSQGNRIVTIKFFFLILDTADSANARLLINIYTPKEVNLIFSFGISPS